jgi:hypothetical protein
MVCRTDIRDYAVYPRPWLNWAIELQSLPELAWHWVKPLKLIPISTKMKNDLDRDSGDFT